MKKGFTLIETFVSLLIFTIVAAGVFLLMTSGTKTWYSSDAQIELQDELRLAMSQIVNDLKLSSPPKLYTDATLLQPFPNDGNPYGSIAFFIDEGVDVSGVIIWSLQPISYTLSGNQILRSDGTNTTVVANKITGMNFTRPRPASFTNVVQIGLSAQKTTQQGQTLNASLISSVSVRN